jgi:hypothetical protein
VVLTVTDNNGLVDTDSMFLAVGGQKDCVGDYDNDRDVDAWDLFKFSESFGRSDCLAFSPIP